MQATHHSFDLRQVAVLLRGEQEPVNAWIAGWDTRRALLCMGVIFVGAGLFGAAVGLWHDPLQSLFSAVKFPAVILFTTLGNALLNAMLAPLLGVNMNLRQSLAAVLMSFTIAAAILGGFSPLLAFVVWNTPSIHSERGISLLAYQFMQLAIVGGIVFAGVMANLRLLPSLESRAASSQAAMRVMLAWLAGNLLLGSQICWVLRPFIGLPNVPAMFLLPEPFHGSFYEEVFEALRSLRMGQTSIRT